MREKSPVYSSVQDLEVGALECWRMIPSPELRFSRNRPHRARARSLIVAGENRAAARIHCPITAQIG